MELRIIVELEDILDVIRYLGTEGSWNSPRIVDLGGEVRFVLGAVLKAMWEPI